MECSNTRRLGYILRKCSMNWEKKSRKIEGDKKTTLTQIKYKLKIELSGNDKKEMRRKKQPRNEQKLLHT